MTSFKKCLWYVFPNEQRNVFCSEEAHFLILGSTLLVELQKIPLPVIHLSGLRYIGARLAGFNSSILLRYTHLAGQGLHVQLSCNTRETKDTFCVPIEHAILHSLNPWVPPPEVANPMQCSWYCCPLYSLLQSLALCGWTGIYSAHSLQS